MTKERVAESNKHSFFGLLQYVFYRSVRTVAAWVAVFGFHLRRFGREHTLVPGGGR